MRLVVLGTFLILLSGWALWGCASSEPLTQVEIDTEKKNLDSFFVALRTNIRDGRAKSVYQSLSISSRDWFDGIRSSSHSEPLNFLVTRPFFEILVILSLRIERRLNPEKPDDPISILRRTLIEIGPIRKSFTKHPVGEFKVLSRDEAEVGLKKSPNVPVYFFTREENGWKMDLVKSLPLILLGAENFARQHKGEPIEQAIYILENMMGSKVLPEDLRH